VDAIEGAFPIIQGGVWEGQACVKKHIYISFVSSNGPLRDKSRRALDIDGFTLGRIEWAIYCSG